MKTDENECSVFLTQAAIDVENLLYTYGTAYDGEARKSGVNATYMYIYRKSISLVTFFMFTFSIVDWHGCCISLFPYLPTQPPPLSTPYDHTASKSPKIELKIRFRCERASVHRAHFYVYIIIIIIVWEK